MEKNKGRIALKTLIYAFIYSVCLYKNLTGIMTPVFSVATVVFFYLVLPELTEDKERGRLRVRKLIPYFIGIVLLGISIFMTADLFIIICSYIGMLLLAMAALIRFFCNEESWGVGRYAVALVETCAAPLVYIDRFFKDGSKIKNAMKQNKNQKKKQNLKYVMIGIVCAIPFLIIVVGLLGSADAIFGNLVNSIFGQVTISWDMAGFLLLMGTVMVYCYCLLYKLSAHGAGNVPYIKNKLEPVIGITFTSMLTAVYLLFSFIQILSPFLGESMLPDGYSYSNYAREGFFQLLFVAALNLFIILVCNAIFAKHKVLKIVLTVMCICTYIMIASSAVRMFMYIETYDLTYLRLLVCFALLLIGILMIGVIISIYRQKFKLMRYFMAVTSVLYILLAFSHPEYIIARYNLSVSSAEQYAEETGLDTRYLSQFSSDAAPAIHDYLEQHGGMEAEDMPEFAKMKFETYFARVDREYNQNKSVRGFNLSSYRGHLCAAKYTN
ncbi:MAG: DUF4173 domain-containing protein [Clostridium sp.]|nr:DUF4173 domain-containing protein [Clostridium sp.]MCM1399449.1 DUF4173 domain-containing protein [Clostridium sp.]MCM1460003.1 DUF4173 domain-containing protein [Bacteroides sp.]